MNKYRISSITESMAMSNFFGQTPLDKASINLAFALHLQGELDIARLERAIQLLLKESILHSYLIFEDKQFFIQEKDSTPFRLTVQTAEGETLEDKQRYVNAFAQKKAMEPLPLFEKDKEQSFFTLFELEKEYHILIMIVHHTFLDFGAVMIAISSIFKAYDDENYQLEPSADYSKFSKEELDFLVSPEAEIEDAYWAREMAGFEQYPLPEDQRDSATPPLSEKDCICLLKRKNLEELASKNRTSVFNITMLMIQMAIAKTNDNNDTLVQYAASNRSNPEYRYTLGCLTRMLCNRMNFDDDMTVTDLNKVMRKKIGDGYQNRHVAAKTPLGTVPYVIVNEDMGELDAMPMFHGKPVPLDFVDLPRRLNIFGILVIPFDVERLAITIETDMEKYGQHAKALIDNVVLAERFLTAYPDKSFGDYMRQDITLETLSRLDEKDSVEMIEI